MDTIWTVLINNFNSIPLWTGWNTESADQNCSQQNVRYMKPILLPSTRTNAVKETLER